MIVVFAVLGPGDEGSESAFGSGGALGIVLLILPGVSFFTVGSLLAVRRAQNAVSWLCLVIGLIWLVIAATGAASQWAFFEGLTGLAEWLGVLGALWVPALGLMATHLPLRLPDGLLLSPRWKWFSRFCTLAIVLVTLGIGTAPGPVNGIAGTRNPVASEQLQVLEPAFALLLIAFLGAMAALVIRYRRSGGTQRLQLRVIAFGGFSFFLVFIVSLASLVGLVPEGSGLEQSLQSLASLFYNAIPIAIAVAVFRYRLYDIDLVINKTLVFIVLAGFITAVYAGIVVGLGRLLPIENDLGLAIAATALVAVAFEPVRVRVQHWANRRVYGRRATPYEALAAMTSRIGDSADPDVVLSEAARLLAEGTGAAQAVIWVAQEGLLTPRASAGQADLDPLPLALLGPDLPALPGADLAQAVRQDGQLVGALSLTKRPGEGVSTADRRLVAELAGQAALLLANTRLRARLSDRLVELRASRQRMLAAQDGARRALERDLHDGAQQELVALKVKLGLARTIATREGATELAAQLAETATIADQAVDTLRDVARGIYPPLLESEGLPAALSAQARRADLSVTVLDRVSRRYPREVEATAYFCAVEALNNAVRHARAGHAHIELDDTAGSLVVTVTDDGDGFDPECTHRGAGLEHMTDRSDAAGGTLTVASRPGHGTTITIALPVAIALPVTSDPALAGASR
jgi:signal transduction histidine kinase